MNDLKVSILIPIYNRGFMLKMVLDSLLNQTYKNIEIILVDDGSTDNTREIALSYPQVKYIYKEDQSIKGAAYTRNIGLKYCTGDIIHFTDSDVISPPDLIETHVKYHLKDEKLIVQGQLVRIIDLNDAYRMPYSPIHYSRAFFDGANVSVRKKWVDLVGEFDYKNLPHEWDDLDFGLSLIEKGLKVKRLTKEGYVWHYEGDYSKTHIENYFKKRMNAGSRAVDFYRKRPTFEVKMMTMIGRFFYFLDKLLFNENKLHIDAFYPQVKKLLEKNKKNEAIAFVRFNAYHYYFKGMKERIKKDGYILKKN